MARSNPRGPARDVDSAERAFRIKAYGWAMAFGVICILPGAALGRRSPLGGLIGGLLGFLLGTFAAGWLATRLAETGGSIASLLYSPSGRSTPSKREYSLAESLIVRGRFFDAADELQRCAEAYPEDVEPKVRLARLYRDELQQPEDAVVWFRRALGTPLVDAGVEQSVLRELVEVYTHRLRRPREAAPWLARLAAQHAATPHGAWAKRELAELKQAMSEE